MEKWLIDNAVQILILLIGGIVALVKLQRFQDKTVGTIEKYAEDFEAHLVAVSPHTSCPAHTSSLADIRESLKEIRQQIATLDDRMFALVQLVKSNGKN